MNVKHGDIAYHNILCAPKSPPGLPSLPSPHDPSRTYACRIVDFGIACKANLTVDRLIRMTKNPLDRMIDNLPWDCILNEND